MFRLAVKQRLHAAATAAVRSPLSGSVAIRTEKLPSLKPTDPVFLKSIKEVAAELVGGKLTSEALVGSALSRIAEGEAYNVFDKTCDLSSSAVAAARETDGRKGSRKSVLDGIPVTIKANFSQEGSVTSAGSLALSTYIAPYDATVVARLKNAGSIPIGRTNMDEFGMGSFNLNNPSGPTYNPLSLTPRTPGGSSGGAAASVCLGSAFAAIGSDTGGSVRLPAAYSGLVGYKPTYGLLSRWGLVSYASSLDCPGILARKADDVAQVLEAVQGADGLDSTCVYTLPQVASTEEYIISNSSSSSSSSSSLSSSPSSSSSSLPLKGLRVGIVSDFNVAELAPSTLQAWTKTANALRQLGAEVVTLSLPLLREALPCYYILAPAEAMSNLSRYEGVRYGPSMYDRNTNTTTSVSTTSSSSAAADGGATWVPKGQLEEAYTMTRTAYLGKEVQRRILIGNFVLSSKHYSTYVAKAMRLRSAITSQLHSAFRPHSASSSSSSTSSSNSGGVDLLLFPTANGPAPTLAELAARATSDPLSGYTDDVMTVVANLAGLPAASFPVDKVRTNEGEEMPVGMQLMGPVLSDRRILRTISALEQVL